MGFGSKPTRPKYKQQADTPWITRNRDMNEWSYNNIADNINRVNVFDDATKASLNAYVDDIYNRAKSDFDRTYSQTMANTLARDYNRFGTTGASSSLLNRDNYNLQQQRALADLAYDRATTYENMINQELQRRYDFLNTNYNYFTNSGQTTQAFDNENWKIRNMNKDIQYLNDIQKYNSKANTWNAIGKTLSTVGGAVANAFLPGSGLIVTGLGNKLTDAFASPVNASGSSIFGIYGNKGTGYVGSSYGDSQSLLPYLLDNNGGSSSINWNDVASFLKNTGSKIGSGLSGVGSKISGLWTRTGGTPTGTSPQISIVPTTSGYNFDPYYNPYSMPSQNLFGLSY